ncbi:HAD family phosphatase [Patescibacteria group bacterium]|nr:HAD family phosphatase [Patescibacteria group bacterium]
MIKLIIFDLDGLLVNSQPLQYETYNQVFSKYGHPITRNDWEEWIQKSFSAKTWIDKHNLKLDSEVIRQEKKKIYDKLIEQKLELMDGAEQLVNLLYGKYPLCVASASRPESIQACLDKFNLTDKFELIVSDVEMERPKPHPDIYLTVAKKMKVNPCDCLVIEDSIACLKSAKSAGMICVVCPDTFSDIKVENYSDADLVVATLNDVSLDTIANLSLKKVDHKHSTQNQHIEKGL